MSKPGSDTRDVFRAPYGTRDVLAPESDRWQDLVARFADRARRFGYGLVLTPIFEHAEVFHPGAEPVTPMFYTTHDHRPTRMSDPPRVSRTVG